jgi:hypothetical protein
MFKPWGNYFIKSKRYTAFKKLFQHHATQLQLQSNLSTTATLGTPKKWPLYRVGRSLQVFQSKLVLKVAWPDLGWPLLTGGRYSEVAVNTGLTVHSIMKHLKVICFFLQKKHDGTH